MIAETYLRSLDISDVTVTSSGTHVNWDDPKEREYFGATLDVLNRHGIGLFAKSAPEQLNPRSIEDHDLIVLMNQRVADEAKKQIAIPAGALTWSIVDIGEGHRTTILDDGNYEEEIYNEITEKVDELVRSFSEIDFKRSKALQ